MNSGESPVVEPYTLRFPFRIAPGQESAHELAQKAVDIYDMRSKLVHEGYLPAQVLSQTTEDARKIVELVLRTKYCRQPAPPN